MTMLVEGRSVMMEVVMARRRKRIKEVRRKTMVTREERDGKTKICLFRFIYIHFYTFHSLLYW